jgi:arylsulfatase A-like enzyme
VKRFAAVAFLLFVACSLFSESGAPSIVWLVTEDNSARYLRLYDDKGAAMPAIERLAKGGIVFNNAFSNGPVCSTARSAIITGCYGPRIFAHFHRAASPVPMPVGLRMFPWYLRQAGYYTTNNNKEDYNLRKGEGVWDESSDTASYRNREPGQPFFHVQNFATTHESRLHFSQLRMETDESQINADSGDVAPIHPKTQVFEYTNARYRQLHEKVDREIAAFLQQLQSDGLLDETIIFYYGDHGGALPGSKGYLYERGLKVPMVIHVPEKWRHLLPTDTVREKPVAPGSRIEGFVQFVDLAPTMLNLAGIDIPAQMDGRPFMGSSIDLAELNSRDFAFGYADRFDEKVDFVRSVRKGRFKYLRSYQPFNMDSLQNNYRYRQLAYQEWRELHRKDALTPEQAQFFEPRQPEVLFDLQADPFELVNLAEDPEFSAQLDEMRRLLNQQVRSMPDLSFIPEPILCQEAIEDPVAYGQSQKERIVRLADIADLSLLPFGEVEGAISVALASDDPLARYWALVVCSSFGNEAAGLEEAVRELANLDSNNLVRMRAAEFLGLTRMADPRPVLIDCLKASQSEPEAVLVLNTITLLHDSPPGWLFDLDRSWLAEEWFTRKPSNVLNRFVYLESSR